MRMMIKFAFPVDAGNDAFRSGKLQKVFQQLAEDLKPHAVLPSAKPFSRVPSMFDSSGVEVPYPT